MSLWSFNDSRKSFRKPGVSDFRGISMLSPNWKLSSKRKSDNLKRSGPRRGASRAVVTGEAALSYGNKPRTRKASATRPMART